MTNEHFKKVIADRLSFYKKVESMLSLQTECARLSQIIAALVLENGGRISPDNWAQVSTDLNRFIPHQISVGKERVDITVKLNEETLIA